MPRRLFLAVAVAASALLSACGGTAATPTPTPSPTPPPALTDPKDVLVQAAAAFQASTSVHVKADLTGKVDPGILRGSAGSSTGLKLDLTGSTIDGDIDIAGSRAKFAGTAPNLFGLTLDGIVDSGTLYLKTSLTGAMYRKVDASNLIAGLPLPSGSSGASPDPSTAAAMADKVKAQLDKLPPATMLPAEQINGVDSYHVQQVISSADVPQASSLPTGTVTLDLWTGKADHRPTRLVIAIDAGVQGSLTIAMDFTSYNAPVDIAPPPADQVSDQPFSVPGLTP